MDTIMKTTRRTTKYACLLQTEENTPDRGTKSYGHADSSRCRQYLKETKTKLKNTPGLSQKRTESTNPLKCQNKTGSYVWSRLLDVNILRMSLQHETTKTGDRNVLSMKPQKFNNKCRCVFRARLTDHFKPSFSKQ